MKYSIAARERKNKILTHDRIPNGVKVQIFEGQTTLIKAGDRWLIDYLSSKLIESHVQ